jgi:hypothetical protein
VIVSSHRTGRTTRLLDWAIEHAQRGEKVVFVCAFEPEVGHVMDLAVTTAASRGIYRRQRRRSVELVGGGSIVVVFSGDPLSRLRRTCPKVAVDDWSAQRWSTRMYLYSWTDEWRTEG